MTSAILERFLSRHDYDVRKSGNGRWIDQKCALDAVCFVADCIVNYLEDGGKEPFQSPDIWRSEYAAKNVQALFGKPDPAVPSARDEYNKFFRQPMKMLAAAGVLREDGVERNAIQFGVANRDVLEYIAMRERNSFEFLCLYITKTLTDSGLWDAFETFFELQTEKALLEAKDAFSDFCRRHTPINTAREANRIFIKVLNPLACRLHKKGVERGRLSPLMITYNKIMYNQTNWRDDAAGKDKNVTRGDFMLQPKSRPLYEYRVSKAMRYLRQFNDAYRGGKSEIVDKFSVCETGTHIHHIFPQSEYAEIADCLENLIALTSGQHLQLAHPGGNTNRVDKQYQYNCLIAKTASIRANIMENKGEPVIYDFSVFMRVLDTGLHSDDFEALPSCDFDSVLTGIEINYR